MEERGGESIGRGRGSGEEDEEVGRKEEEGRRRKRKLERKRGRWEEPLAMGYGKWEEGGTYVRKGGRAEGKGGRGKDRVRIMLNHLSLPFK